MKVTTNEGKEINYDTKDDNLIEFNTKKGVTYTLAEIPHMSTSSHINTIIDQYEKTGDLDDEEVIHSLKTHLTAVSHYEKNEKSKKVVKHTKSFKLLLKQYRDNELISNQTYESLKGNADYLIEQWK